jgi:NADH:ubiquinone oxidoreductase subunit E/NAD-dependent dihydropyrimidine dehydrogenase PreA subunit
MNQTPNQTLNQTTQEIQLTLDGARLTCPPGTTILEAAEKAGITIPRLCHVGELLPSGACRICVVEVAGFRTLVGSCHTPVAEGMVVTTSSPRVKRARRAVIELLLTGHTGACVTDQRARECSLHKLAADLEVGPPRFHVKRPRLYAPEDQNPYVRRDMSKCILCRKCIRACRELAGQNVYSMAYRGFRSKVVVDTDVPLTKEVCKECGICIEVCPTNALSWPEGVTQQEGKRKAPLPENNRTNLLDLLSATQRRAGFLSEASLTEIASALDLPLSEVFGVASFYAFLATKPQGAHVIRVCKSLPCSLKEAPRIIESVQKTLGIAPGEVTPDGQFSFTLTNCIGACDQAPALMIDETVYGNLTPSKIAAILTSYREEKTHAPHRLTAL